MSIRKRILAGWTFVLDFRNFREVRHKETPVQSETGGKVLLQRRGGNVLNNHALELCSRSPRPGFVGRGVRGEGIAFLSSRIAHRYLVRIVRRGRNPRNSPAGVYRSGNHYAKRHEMPGDRGELCRKSGPDRLPLPMLPISVPAGHQKLAGRLSGVSLDT